MRILLIILCCLLSVVGMAQVGPVITPFPGPYGVFNNYRFLNIKDSGTLWIMRGVRMDDSLSVAGPSYTNLAPADGDSSTRTVNSAWVKRNGGSGGSVPCINGLQDGTGLATNTGGMNFNITEAVVTHNCVKYTIATDVVTLEAAEDSGRFDLLVANFLAGTFGYIKGDKGSAISVPLYDTATQFPIAVVLVTDTGNTISTPPIDPNWTKIGLYTSSITNAVVIGGTITPGSNINFLLSGNGYMSTGPANFTQVGLLRSYGSGLMTHTALQSSHKAADSMIVWNSSDKQLGMRAIVGGGTTIYTGDGTISANRTVTVDAANQLRLFSADATFSAETIFKKDQILNHANDDNSGNPIDYYNGINVGSGSFLGVITNSGSTTNQLSVKSTGATYESGIDGAGIQYNADYSADYTNRSLVDKEYVDSHSGGLDSTAVAAQIEAAKDTIDTFGGLVVRNIGPNHDSLGLKFAPGALMGAGSDSVGRAVTVDSSLYLRNDSLGLPYNVYVALISQSGTSDPTVTVLQNTFGAPIVWTYSGSGSYFGTLTGAFIDGKTTTLSGVLLPGGVEDPAVSILGTRASDDIYNLQTGTQAAGHLDDVLVNYTIEIRVYKY